MERLTRKRRERLLDKYGDKVRPLTKKQTDWCLKDTARYIWFDNKDAVNGHCERCDKDVTFDKKTKHNAEVRCPECKQKMTARHSWRKRLTSNVDFRVITTVHGDEIFLRYILIDQYNKKREIREVAREIINLETATRRELEKTYKGWDVSSKQKWFQEYFMWQYRKYCCLRATVYMPGFKAELRKIKALSHLEDATAYLDDTYYIGAFIVQLTRVSNVYEKLEKVGLKEFAIKEFRNYMRGYSQQHKFYDMSQTSLVKILKLNKGTYKSWLNYKTLEALSYLQNFPNIKPEILDYVLKNKISEFDYRMVLESNIGHEAKVLKYITENNIKMAEYNHYIYMLRYCDYKLDKAYLFPKDFRKEDERLSGEYESRKLKLAMKKRVKNSALIKKISDGLRNMDNLKEFMNGSNGLLIYVPESAEDLEKEGKALHNCIGTYVNRVAEGKTLVFFVRKLNAPQEPFVAFEYYNGKVVQIRYDHNKVVDDSNVIDFVNRFANNLKLVA